MAEVGHQQQSPSDVNFYDYDGTLVAGYTIAEAQALSALPIAPDHSADDVPLTFQEWNYTLTAVNGTTQKIDVGATYITTDGKTHFKIRVTAVSGGTVPFYFLKSNASDTLSIDFGDGQTANSDSISQAVTFTPATPLAVGEYDVKVWISSGSGKYYLGNNSSGYVVVGGSTQNYRNTLLQAFVGNNVIGFRGYAFYQCYVLSSITISNSVISFGHYVFQSCRSLSSVVIPSSVTSCGYSPFDVCKSLSFASVPSGFIWVNPNAFSQCNALSSVVIPSGVTSVQNSLLHSCYSLSSVVIPSSVTSIGTHAFYQCYALSSVVIPSGVTSIGDRAFYQCYALSSVVIPSGVTSVGDSAFYQCNANIEYDFSNCTSVPTLSNINAFTNIISACIMKIPSALYDTWKVATNWSTYASYMVAV